MGLLLEFILNAHLLNADDGELYKLTIDRDRTAFERGIVPVNSFKDSSRKLDLIFPNENLMKIVSELSEIGQETDKLNEYCKDVSRGMLTASRVKIANIKRRLDKVILQVKLLKDEPLIGK